MKQLLPILFLFLIVFACEETFDPPPQALLNASLNYSDTVKNKELASIVVSAYGLEHEEIWIDEDTIQKNSQGKRSILLPLRSLSSTDFVFVLNEKNDTVRFISESGTKYESIESGFYTEYKLLDVEYTTNKIDSITVVDSLVTKDWNENIIIYINQFLPDTED